MSCDLSPSSPSSSPSRFLEWQHRAHVSEADLADVLRWARQGPVRIQVRRDSQPDLTLRRLYARHLIEVVSLGCLEPGCFVASIRLPSACPGDLE